MDHPLIMRTLRRARYSCTIDTPVRCAIFAGPINARSKLFCSRIGSLSSAHHRGDEGSELGYMLPAETNLPAGRTISMPACEDAQSRLRFQLPAGGRRLFSPAGDDRSHPLAKRITGAIRLVGTPVRLHPGPRGGRQSAATAHSWLLFEEAFANSRPILLLLSHMAADARHWASRPAFFQGQSSPAYEVTSRGSRGRPMDDSRLACRSLVRRAYGATSCRRTLPRRAPISGPRTIRR